MPVPFGLGQNHAHFYNNVTDRPGRDGNKRFISGGFEVVLTGLKICLLVILVVMAAGCSSGDKSQKKDVKVPDTAEPGAPQWTFGSNEVMLRFKADSMLNNYDGTPHTVVVGIYQVSDPNAFQGMAKTKDGMLTLLKCQRFGDTVMSVEKIIIQPGELRNAVLDRAKGAQWVAVVVGYYGLIPQNGVRMYPIPINVVTKGLIFKTKYQLPGLIYVSMNLDPDMIRDDAVNEPPKIWKVPAPTKSSPPPEKGAGADSSATSSLDQEAASLGKDAIKEVGETEVEKIAEGG